MASYQKGKEIRFIAGKYQSVAARGWLNAAESWGTNADDPDETTAPVIVLMKKGKGMRATTVNKASFKIVEDEKAPTSYAGRVLRACPEIERNLVTVTRQMAKCDVDKDKNGFQKVMINYLDDAVQWQKNQGSKAMYRKIEWQDPNGMDI